MDVPTWLLLVALFFSLLLSAFFSSSETAMIALDKYRLRHLAQTGNRAAILAEKFLQKPDELLGLILLGNNFINILASTIATLIALRIGGDFVLVFSTALLTFVVLIFAEVAPKTLAAKHPEHIAFFAIYILLFLRRVLFPITFLVKVMSNSFLRLLRIHNKSNQAETAMNREQLRSLIQHSDNNLTTEVTDLMQKVLGLEDYRIDQIMVPRHEIIGIDIQDDKENILSLVKNSPYNRLPVYNDNINQLLGILYVRDLLPSMTNFSKQHIEKLAKPCYFVPENLQIQAQLLNFRKEQQSLAIIVDEYGEVTGLLTINDILEELVGRYTSDINDYDIEYNVREDGSLFAKGSCSLKTLENEQNIVLKSSNASSLNGFLIDLLGSVPLASCCILYDNYQIEITSVNNLAIVDAIIYPLEIPETTDDV